jgi:hypothetical protein
MSIRDSSTPAPLFWVALVILSRAEFRWSAPGRRHEVPREIPLIISIQIVMVLKHECPTSAGRNKAQMAPLSTTL